MYDYSFLDIESFAAQIYASAIQQGQRLLLTPYGYTVTFTDFDIGETLTQSLNITANAAFILTGLRYYSVLPADAVIVSGKVAQRARVLITDSGSGEQFTNSAVNLENYAGNGDVAHNLPFPRFINGRTSLNIQLTSFATAGDDNNTLDLYLDGVLVRTVS